MAITTRTYVSVSCDNGCGIDAYDDHYAGNTPVFDTAKDARDELELHGWAFTDNEAYCPHCAPSQQVTDMLAGAEERRERPLRADRHDEIQARIDAAEELQGRSVNPETGEQR